MLDPGSFRQIAAKSGSKEKIEAEGTAQGSLNKSKSYVNLDLDVIEQEDKNKR